jgi:hypothetical protein
MLFQFSQLHPHLLFTVEYEENGNVNFLDLTIHRTNKDLSASIFRKPTATDIMIHHDSCHTIEHKLLGVN